VNFLEKVIEVKKGEITFSIWDLGGQREYLHMLPIVCNEAACLLFMFDLSRKATLSSVKAWYRPTGIASTIQQSCACINILFAHTMCDATDLWMQLQVSSWY
jgi:GTPase SAR1 family protein